MSTRYRALVACGLALAAPLVIAGWGAAAAQPAPTTDPAGNNGTVKIAAEDEANPRNSPHVSCTFDIAWYGFDEGEDIISSVSFEALAPTADVVISGTEPAQVFVGEDAAGGGTDLDGQAGYSLSFAGEPAPEQGYHVKVTVHTVGSQGADTKHKVVWVEPCDGGGEDPPTAL